MPRKRYEYKFIVDNKWSYSKFHPTSIDENGNINNYIDTTTIEINKHLREQDKMNKNAENATAIAAQEEEHIKKKQEFEAIAKSIFIFNCRNFYLI